VSNGVTAQAVRRLGDVTEAAQLTGFDVMATAHLFFHRALKSKAHPSQADLVWDMPVINAFENSVKNGLEKFWAGVLGMLG